MFSLLRSTPIVPKTLVLFLHTTTVPEATRKKSAPNTLTYVRAPPPKYAGGESEPKSIFRLQLADQGQMEKHPPSLRPRQKKGKKKPTEYLQ